MSPPLWAAQKAADNSASQPLYNKVDFFDSMSCEALEKAQGEERAGRGRYAEQRKLDMETFGSTNNPNRARGGRWGGVRHAPPARLPTRVIASS